MFSESINFSHIGFISYDHDVDFQFFVPSKDHDLNDWPMYIYMFLFNMVKHNYNLYTFF